MNCPTEEQLSAFADRELDAAEHATIQEHLTTCATCREIAEQMRCLDVRGRTALRSIPVPTATNPVVVPFPEPTAPIRYRVALAAAAAVVIGFAGILWFSQLEKDPSPITTKSTPVARDVASQTDDSFEQWAKPYRDLKIPLLPPEAVLTLRNDEVQPITFGPNPNGQL